MMGQSGLGEEIAGSCARESTMLLEWGFVQVAQPPNKNLALTGRRGVDHVDSQVRPESIGISPVRLPDATEEHDAPIEFDAEVGLFVGWRL